MMAIKTPTKRQRDRLPPMVKIRAFIDIIQSARWAWRVEKLYSRIHWQWIPTCHHLRGQCLCIQLGLASPFNLFDSTLQLYILSQASNEAVVNGLSRTNCLNSPWILSLQHGVMTQNVLLSSCEEHLC